MTDNEEVYEAIYFGRSGSTGEVLRKAMAVRSFYDAVSARRR